MEEVDIIDENDGIIGKCSKNDADEKKFLHRVVHCFVINDKKDIFLVKRAKHRRRGAGLYDASIGGHVKSGESYDEAMKREGIEELGVQGDYKFLFKHVSKIGLNHMIAVYLLKYNGKIEVNKDESSEGYWKSFEEIMKISEEKFTPEFYVGLMKLKSILP